MAYNKDYNDEEISHEIAKMWSDDEEIAHEIAKMWSDDKISEAASDLEDAFSSGNDTAKRLEDAASNLVEAAKIELEAAKEKQKAAKQQADNIKNEDNAVKRRTKGNKSKATPKDILGALKNPKALKNLLLGGKQVALAHPAMLATAAIGKLAKELTELDRAAAAYNNNLQKTFDAYEKLGKTSFAPGSYLSDKLSQATDQFAAAWGNVIHDNKIVNAFKELATYVAEALTPENFVKDPTSQAAKAYERAQKYEKQGWLRTASQTAITAIESSMWKAGLGATYAETHTDKLMDALTPLIANKSEEEQIQYIKEISQLLESGNGFGSLSGIMMNDQILRSLVEAWSNGKYSNLEFDRLGEQDVYSMREYGIITQLELLKVSREMAANWQADAKQKGQLLEQIKINTGQFSFDEIITAPIIKTRGQTGGQGGDNYFESDKAKQEARLAKSFEKFLELYNDKATREDKIKLLLDAGYSSKEAEEIVDAINNYNIADDKKREVAWLVYANGLEGNKISLETVVSTLDKIEKDASAEIDIKIPNLGDLETAKNDFARITGISTATIDMVLRGDDTAGTALDEIKKKVEEILSLTPVTIRVGVAGYENITPGEGITSKEAKEGLEALNKAYTMHGGSQGADKSTFYNYRGRALGYLRAMGIEREDLELMDDSQLYDFTENLEKNLKGKYVSSYATYVKSSNPSDSTAGMYEKNKVRAKRDILNELALYGYTKNWLDKLSTASVEDLKGWLDWTRDKIDRGENPFNGIPQKMYDTIFGTPGKQNKDAYRYEFDPEEAKPKGWAATGALVTGPMPINVGEGGRAEAIVPLETQKGVDYMANVLRQAGLESGGGSTTVNVSLNGQILEMNDYNTTRLANKIGAIIDNQKNRRGSINYERA